MRSEKVLQPDALPWPAPMPGPMPSRAGPLEASDKRRQRAALRLRRLSERQRAAAGDPAGLRAPPAAILALFQ